MQQKRYTVTNASSATKEGGCWLTEWYHRQWDIWTHMGSVSSLQPRSETGDREKPWLKSSLMEHDLMLVGMFFKGVESCSMKIMCMRMFKDLKTYVICHNNI